MKLLTLSTEPELFQFVDDAGTIVFTVSRPAGPDTRGLGGPGQWALFNGDGLEPGTDVELEALTFFYDLLEALNYAQKLIADRAAGVPQLVEDCLSLLGGTHGEMMLGYYQTKDEARDAVRAMLGSGMNWTPELFSGNGALAWTWNNEINDWQKM